MREKALEVLKKHVKAERLIKHSLAVEAGMIAYAGIFGEDRELWGAIGLLHDVDYEEFPEEHTIKCYEILKTEGYKEDFIKAVQSHWPENSGVPQDTQVAKVLHACDEMCGFMVACALVRDPKGFTMELKSVKKKFKDKAFARAISRENAVEAAEAMGITFEEHITNLISGMAKREAELNAIGESLL